MTSISHIKSICNVNVEEKKIGSVIIGIILHLPGFNHTAHVTLYISECYR